MDLDARIRRYFDELAEGEWSRLEDTPRAQVALEVHRRFLADYVTAGDRVLEIGAGPGRFTIALAELGARVVVTDVSDVQLDLNHRYVSESGHERSVEARYPLDIRQTERFANDEFDLVLAYGGPLSYVFEDATDALRGCLRVGRRVVASVMSTLGAWRLHLAAVVALEDTIGPFASDQIIETGDLRYEGDADAHVCQMYRAREVEAMIRTAGGEVLAMSASNCASMGDENAVRELLASPDRRGRFLDLEVAACREPSVLDGGTHLLFAARSA
jgi:SAM-dependent methyltransferase